MNEYLESSYCRHPWYYMDVNMRGFKVCCWSYKLQPLLFNSNGDLDVIGTWNGEIAKEIRREMLENNWVNCRSDFCPLIQNKTLGERSKMPSLDELSSGPEHIQCELQIACNLWCPQCRLKKINNINDPYKDTGEIIFKGIKQYILNTKKNVTMSMLGHGEPFYVKTIRKFLFETDLTNKPNIKLGFNTNGLLFTPRTWEKMVGTRKNVDYLAISVDASTKETYNKIRLGSNWNQLQKNLKFISELKATKQIRDVWLSFVVQKDNYKEIVNFMKMAESFGFWAYYTKYMPGIQPEEIGKEQMVWDSKHPLYQDFVNVLRDPYLKGKYLSSIKIYVPSD